MSIGIKLTRQEIIDAIGIVDKDIIDNYKDCIDKNIFSENEELGEEEQREFIRWSVCNNKEEFFRQINILHEFRLLIKRNEIVDKIQELSIKDVGNFAEKLVLEIAEDSNGNEELLNKVHEILNK